jgi:transposase
VARAGLEKLEKLPLLAGRGRQRADLLQLVKQVELDARLEQEAAQRPEGQRLARHPGVGTLTALGIVLVLGPVERFPDARTSPAMWD